MLWKWDERSSSSQTGATVSAGFVLPGEVAALVVESGCGVESWRRTGSKRLILTERGAVVDGCRVLRGSSLGVGG
jgi:hypothetical protein